MESVELPAGPDQILVLYRPADMGTEVDPFEVFAAVAADAGRGRHAASGWSR